MKRLLEQHRISALRSSGFRRYASVQFLSSMSVSAQRVAELWLVYQITGEGLSIGTSTAIRTAPTLVLAGLAGTLADRFARKGLLTATQVSRGILAGLLVFLTVGKQAEDISILWVYLIILGLGCVGGFDQPFRRATVRDVVTKSDLPSAASLHTATISMGRIIGPLAVGGLMTWSGAPAAFIFSCVSALLSAATVRFLRMLSPEERGVEQDEERNTNGNHPADQGEHAQGPSTNQETSREEALQKEAQPESTSARIKPLIFSHQLRPTYLMLAAFSIIGLNIEVVFPLIASRVLIGGVGTFSTLVTYMSIGALAGSLLAAFHAKERTNNQKMVWALVFCGATMLAVSAGANNVLVAFSVVAVGVCTGIFLSFTSASIQTGATREVQGRQAALYSFVFVGGRAVGAPITGWLADRLGARPTVVVLSLGTLLAAVLAFALISKQGEIRPIRSAKTFVDKRGAQTGERREQTQ